MQKKNIINFWLIVWDSAFLLLFEVLHDRNT
jgi:hypothetical protein